MEVKKLKTQADFKSHKIAKSVICHLKKVIRNGDTVLDVGAGDGYLLELLSKNFKNIKTYGIDPDPKSKNISKGGIEKIPFPDSSVNIVICTDVLEHLTDPQLRKGIKEINRVLKQGGKVIVTTVVNEDFSKQLCVCPNCKKIFHKIGHRQIFEPKELISLFNSNNFRVIKTFNFNLTLFSKFPSLIKAINNLKLERMFGGEVRYRLKKDFLLIAEKKVEAKICPVCDCEDSKVERRLGDYFLLQCQNCHFIYSNLSKKEIEKVNFSFDKKNSEQYENTQSKFDRDWFKYVAEKTSKNFNQIAKRKVLDIGCGNGLLLGEFKKIGWQCYGLDPSPWSKKYAKDIGFKLFSKDIYKAAIKNNYFDLIVCSSTLEHVERPVEFIRKIYEILKSGGRAYFIGVPNYSSLSIKLGISHFDNNQPPFHVSYFTPRSFKYVLQKISISNHLITSYGIPMGYSFYRKIKTIKRGVTEVSSRKKSFLTHLFVLVNYYFGKPFRLGDKLEVIIEKK